MIAKYFIIKITMEILSKWLKNSNSNYVSKIYISVMIAAQLIKENNFVSV